MLTKMAGICLFFFQSVCFLFLIHIYGLQEQKTKVAWVGLCVSIQGSKQCHT